MLICCVWCTALGEWIMRMTEPLMENNKPLFIRTVNFKQCTFGTTPLVFPDAPTIVEEATDRVVVEVGFLPAAFLCTFASKL